MERACLENEFCKIQNMAKREVIYMSRVYLCYGDPIPMDEKRKLKNQYTIYLKEIFHQTSRLLNLSS